MYDVFKKVLNPVKVDNIEISTCSDHVATHFFCY